MKFATITADPPWAFRVWNAEGRHKSASAHYGTQSANPICGLGKAVQPVAAEDCCRLLWATWPNLSEALRVIEAWGFEYKTLGFDWLKLTSSGTPRLGLGYWSRSNSEPCLLATRGNPKRLDKGVSQIIECPIGLHSEKPLEIYDRVERLVAGPYLELFARPYGGLLEDRPDWTRLGNEMPGNLDICEALEMLAAKEQPTPILRVQATAQVELGLEMESA